MFHAFIHSGMIYSDRFIWEDPINLHMLHLTIWRLSTVCYELEAFLDWQEKHSLSLEIVNCQLQARGFSRVAREAILKSRRPSTARLWPIYWSWCLSREIYGTCTTIEILIKFFQYLGYEKQFSGPAVKKCCCTLSSVLHHANWDITHNLNLKEVFNIMGWKFHIFLSEGSCL